MYQEDDEFGVLTMEEREELESLHHEEMAPTQEEEDWMLLIAIEEERSALAKKYLPVLSDYKVKGICDMCKRYFYKNGSLEEHIKKNHTEEISHQKIQVIPQEVWLSKSLPNLEELLATVPSHILVSKEDELESKKDFEDIMFDLKKVKVQTSDTKKSTYICDQCKFNTFSNKSMQIHIKNIHENFVHKCEQCSVCFLSDNNLRIHKKLTHNKKDLIIKKSLNLIKGEAGSLSDFKSNPNRGQVLGGGEDQKSIYIDNESDSEEEVDEKDESTSSEYIVNTKNSLFTEKQWGEDEDNLDPAGINYKSKMSGFAKSAEVLRKAFRKGSIKKVGEMKAHVEEVKRKGTGTELRIKVADCQGEGEIKLSFWGPNKKTKETTIQINIIKGNDKRFVKLFSEEFIKGSIDKIVNGKVTEQLFEKQDAKVLCPTCQKPFAKEASLNIHMKSHPMCSKCGKGFKEIEELESHKIKSHSSKQKPSVKTVLPEENIQMCEDCGHKASSRKSLMIHKEKEHIGDHWLVNTKREANMMNSEKESIKTKTEEPQPKRTKKNETINDTTETSLSDRMDKKVLQKRKIEDERDLLWEKEKQRADLLKEEKAKKIQIKEKAEKTKTMKLTKSKDTMNLDKPSPKSNTTTEIVPGKELPKGVEKIVGDKYELERIPGNGACGIGAFAKHAYNDVSLGPKIGAELNSEIAKNFWHYKQLLEWPYDRPVGGAENVKFEQHEEEKLLNFLQNHPRNGFVWRGFMDMQALSNKFGMPIKIISIKDFSDPNPKVEQMEPDKDFEVKEAMEEMILLNTGNYHFDLIRKKESVECEQKNERQDKSNHDSIQKENHQISFEKSEREEIKELKIVVEEMRREIQCLRQHTCSNTIANSKTTSHREEIQKNVKSSESRNKCDKCEKTFVNNDALTAHKREKHEQLYECNSCVFSSKSSVTLEQHKEEVHRINYMCKKCKKTFINEEVLTNHMEIHEKKARLEEFNCETCDFQNTKRQALKKHLEESPGHKPSPKEYECRNCKLIFHSYYNMMNHRSLEHPTKKMCRYFKAGTCNHSDEECWYSHEKTPSTKKMNKNKAEDFQEKTKNLPPDMNMLIHQLIKIVSETKN